MFFMQFGFNWLTVVFSTAAGISTGNLGDLVEVSCASPESRISNVNWCVAKFHMHVQALKLI